MAADSPWAFVYGPPYNLDPIDWAEQQLANLFLMQKQAIVDRAADPAAWPILGPDISDEAFARRALGALLDYGWQPPAVPSATVTTTEASR